MSTNNNRFAKLDEPNPSHEEPSVTATRRQRGKATKENTQAMGSAPAAQVTATSASNITSIPNEKPKEKGWEASLTLAQLKAYKDEQAIKAHNARFPPKPKQDPAPAKTDKAQAKAKKTANANQTHAGLKNVMTATQGNARWANVARTEIDGYKAVPAAPQAPCSGCGIKDCPVHDKHERRVYAVMDPTRPNLIKKIQAKFGPSESELRTLTQFFESHKRDAELRGQEGESQKQGGK